MTIPNFKYVRPSTLREAVRHARGDGARLHAGGTDLMGCLHDDVLGAETVVSLSALDDLRGVRETSGGGLRIGALTTITEVAEHPVIRERWAALAQGASEVASPQLRNQGTLGGNLCQKPRCWYYRGDFDCLRKGGDLCYARNGEHPFHAVFGHADTCYIVHPSDTAPALVAFGAEVEVEGPGGSRRLPVADLHVPPAEDPMREVALEDGEVVTAVLLPPADGAASSYRKVRARRAWDFALAGAALVIHFDGDVVERARVVLSGAAPVPWRSTPVEEAITGEVLTDQVIARAAEAAVRDADPLPGNRYKVPLFRAVLSEELEKIRPG